MDRLIKAKDYSTAMKFNKTWRSIDDLFTLNNDGRMNELMSDVYPPELQLNKENCDDSSTSFLDLAISIRDEQVVHTLYDKRDDFKFAIVNFPFLCGNVVPHNAYGVFTGQLIRYANACMDMFSFIDRARALIHKLVRQGFLIRKLTRTFDVFYERHFFSVSKYGKSMRDLRAFLFCQV